MMYAVMKYVTVGVLAAMYDHADKNKDGCVDKKEFRQAQEMEGPPPGFEKQKKESMSEEEFKKQACSQHAL